MSVQLATYQVLLGGLAMRAGTQALVLLSLMLRQQHWLPWPFPTSKPLPPQGGPPHQPQCAPSYCTNTTGCAFRSMGRALRGAETPVRSLRHRHFLMSFRRFLFPCFLPLLFRFQDPFSFFFRVFCFLGSNASRQCVSVLLLECRISRTCLFLLGSWKSILSRPRIFPKETICQSPAHMCSK